MFRSARRSFLTVVASLLVVSCGSAVATANANGVSVGDTPTAHVAAALDSVVSPTPEVYPPVAAAIPSSTRTPGMAIYTLARTISVTPSAVQVVDVQSAPTPPAAAAPPEHLRIAAIGLETDVEPLGWTVQESDGGAISVWQDLPAAKAAWLLNSAAPGQGSNVVLSGHHNMGAEVFRYLVDLQPGDTIVLTAGGRDFVYVVAERVIVPERDATPEQRRQNAAWMQPTRCERLTLVTCWPYETNTHRLIVVADPVEGTSLALDP